MKNRIILFLIILMSLNGSLSLFGCTCMPPYYYNFKDALTLHPLFISNNKAIILGIIKNKSADNKFMTVESLDIISGSVPGEYFTVAGQDGVNCGMELSSDSFKLNDTLVMCLTNDFYNRIDTLELNGCSLSYLFYGDNSVKGNISSSIQEMLYDDFKTYVLSGFVLSNHIISLNEDFLSYTLNMVSKELILLEPFDYLTAYRIYDLSGRLADSGDFEDNFISVSNLKSGMYCVLLLSDNILIGRLKLIIPGNRPPPG